MLSYIFLSRLTPYADRIIGYHYCEFCLNRSTTDEIFCIHETLKKKEYTGTRHQLTIDFENDHDSVGREILYSMLTEFGIPMKLIRLIKMCLNETCSKVYIGKNLLDTFPIWNGLKKGDALSPLLFNFSLDYGIRKVQENQEGMKSNGTHQIVVYADDYILGKNINTTKK